MRSWFTADTHFGHKNIVEYCRRPFKSTYDMDRTIILNWNARVGENDTVFHLGDFAYKNRLSVNSYEKYLKGKLILIRGNHDHNNNNRTIIENIMIHIGGRNIFLTHEPDFAHGGTYGGGVLTLCGHVHENWKFRHYEYPEFEVVYDAVNVGVDVWNFMPVSIEEILKEYERWKKHEIL
jgi:calcineurin-like phosphoesterase family protein